MPNIEWNPRPPALRPGEYARYSVWGEDVHPHHTFEEEETMEEEYDEETTEEEEYSFYEEMLADSFIRDASLIDNAVRLSVSTPPRLTIAEDVSMTFNYSDKATIIQEVTDGQLSFTVQENAALQSIKIHANNRTWTIPLDAFPVSPPSMPKKR